MGRKRKKKKVTRTRKVKIVRAPGGYVLEKRLIGKRGASVVATEWKLKKK